MPRFLAALAALVFLVSGAPAQAPAPRDELLRLVPDDVALCLVVNDLRGQGDKLFQSAWLKHLKESPLLQALGEAPELLQLAQVKEQLQKRLQITWPQLRDEILGDAMVFAYRAGPPGKPERDQGLLLLHARDPKLLAGLLERLNAIQLKNGELKEVRQREHRGVKYVERVEADGRQFYLLDGSFLAFSGQEAMLKSVLERRADSKAPALPALKQLAEIGCERALVSVWINPRAVDGLLQAQAAELGNTPDAQALKTFLSYWKALDGVTLSLRTSKSPEVVVGVHARIDALPAPARKLVEDASQPSDVWGRLPADAILTVAARTDFAALLETLDQVLPGDAGEGLSDFVRRSTGLPLGKEVLKELAPHFGPDWGICLAAPPDKESFPHLLFALRMRTKPGEPEFGHALIKMLHLFARSAVNDYNRKHQDKIQLKVENQGGVEMHYLVNDAKFPRGFRPAFAYTDGYLVVASSPEALARFGKHDGKPAGTASPLVRVSFQKLAALIKERRAALIDFMAEKRQITPEAAAARLDALAWGLGLFERAEVVQQTDGNRVAWVFRVTAK
jgi:hypothetical protein